MRQRRSPYPVAVFLLPPFYFVRYVLSMSGKQISVLGIDIGGTGIKAGCVNILSGTIDGEIITVPTPQPATTQGTLQAVQEVVRTFDWCGAVGIGYPGVVKQGVALSAANLAPEWLNKDLTQIFAPISSEPVTVINDADAAGLAEMRFGAGQENAHPKGGLVLICTFGTGIGSGLFYRGTLIPNMEFGHIEIDGTDAELAAAGSTRTRENLSWKEWGERANRYLCEMERLLSFDQCIIGGGISENFDSFRPYLHLRAEVRVAKLGNDAGIIGAALATERT